MVLPSGWLRALVQFLQNLTVGVFQRKPSEWLETLYLYHTMGPSSIEMEVWGQSQQQEQCCSKLWTEALLCLHPSETGYSSIVKWLQLDQLEIASDGSVEVPSEQLVVTDLSAAAVAAVAGTPWSMKEMEQVAGMLVRHD